VHKHYFQWEKLQNQEVTTISDTYSKVQISHTCHEIFIPSLSCSMLYYTGGSGIYNRVTKLF